MYIIDYKRTPFGKFLGNLNLYSATELTHPIFKHFIDNYPILQRGTDLVVLGNVLSAGLGMNPARIAGIKGGISKKTPAITINQVCASSLTALIYGHQAIAANEANIVIAGGMESMSNAPHLITGLRRRLKMGNMKITDSLISDGLRCSLANQLMGETAENIARKYAISRHDQDNYASNSHRKACKAQKLGLIKHEIIDTHGVITDEGPRCDTNYSKLSSLRPVFNNKGSVTAGNASTLSDGAGLMILASKRAVKRYSLKPIAKILHYAMVGLQPKFMGMGPELAIRTILKKAHLTVKNIDIFEINEAFSVQVLAVINQLNIPSSKVNLMGGAIAYGHPLGASGVRIVGSLINSLRLKQKKLGIASLCVGGGQGVAILIERI